jgi:tungstate transport system substrate-binding protein
VFFISRGDDSGTYKKEISLWKDTGIAVPDKERWYIQTGQGMINTINIAAEMGAYTISDRGTFIKYESGFKVTPPLVILAEGGRVLRNQYSVVKLNPDRCVDAKHDLADIFIDWISSAEVQMLISNFRLLGKQLFIPNTRDK